VNTFDELLKKNLNKPQKEAVVKENGSILVIAGAGSGKTRVITSRIAHLIIKQNATPESILALTFTNKAAEEMKARLTRLLGTTRRLSRRLSMPFVGTFHAYCLLLLRTNPTLLPFSDFSIIDENDQKALLKKLIKSNNLEKQVSVTQIKHQISKSKNQLEGNTEIYKNPFFKEIFLAYETEKSQSHCFDFDDLLLTVLHIFQKNKNFKKRFQEKIRHLLVDEYQDTNGVQHELLKEMSLRNKKFSIDSICSVGDEDQSIYSWRGAKVANMLSFQEDFKPVTMIKIEQNYRSVQPILKAANKVIEHNKQRHPKKLWSDKKGRNRILSITCQSGYQEADTISSYLKMLPTRTRLRDIAILYRTHFQSRSIEESLIRNSIPYVIIGGIRFYERKEIKDLLAYLRLIFNPFDRPSLFRIINTPARGLGSKFEEQLYNAWNQNPLLDFKQILSHMIKKENLTATKKNSLKKFIVIFDKLTSKEKPGKTLQELLECVEYLSYLRNAYDPRDADTKIENIQEFARSIENKRGSLEDFLHEVALLQEKFEKKEEEVDTVQMMTLHAAKGLEFNTVIIAGLEEGLLPSSKSLHDADAIEEERRLFYVGITRAMERLVLLRAMFRNTYGQVSDQITSRFITEIPNTLLHQIDATKVHPAKIRTLIAQWLGSKFTPPVTTFSPLDTKANRKTGNVSRNTSPWKNRQVVLHKIFGPGMIKKIEVASGSDYYLTILFKNGEKRILSTFVRAL
jgi:DNA helicase-2/ATP-dependent DNA helicase PcrA